MLNFHYVLSKPKTGVRFAGVISDLKRKEADVGVSHLFLTYDRIVGLRLDYTVAINTDHYSFLVSLHKIFLLVKKEI